MANINLSPFVGTTIVLLFVYSTIFTLVYIYSVDASMALDNDMNGVPDAQDPTSVVVKSSGIFGFGFGILDGILDALALISPLTLLKPIYALILKDTPFLSMLFYLLIWRPLSVAVSVVAIVFMISKIPTVSGESG